MSACTCKPIGRLHLDSCAISQQPPPRPSCKGCGGYLKAKDVDGYCSCGCSDAFEAGKVAAVAEVVAMLEQEADAVLRRWHGRASANSLERDTVQRMAARVRAMRATL